MNTTQRGLIMQRWSVVQQELMPELRSEVGPLTPRLQKVIHTLEWVRIEAFVESTWWLTTAAGIDDTRDGALDFVSSSPLFDSIFTGMKLLAQ